nr:FHA domain-containing protein [Pseudoflavonifractor sp. 524-17]
MRNGMIRAVVLLALLACFAVQAGAALPASLSVLSAQSELTPLGAASKSGRLEPEEPAKGRPEETEEEATGVKAILNRLTALPAPVLAGIGGGIVAALLLIILLASRRGKRRKARQAEEQAQYGQGAQYAPPGGQYAPPPQYTPAGQYTPPPQYTPPGQYTPPPSQYAPPEQYVPPESAWAPQGENGTRVLGGPQKALTLLQVMVDREETHAEYKLALMGDIRVGRGKDNTLSLPEDDAISTHHFLLRDGGEGSVILRDVGSTNGTWLFQNKGKTRLEPEQDYPLPDGAAFMAGDTRFQVFQVKNG